MVIDKSTFGSEYIWIWVSLSSLAFFLGCATMSCKLVIGFHYRFPCALSSLTPACLSLTLQASRFNNLNAGSGCITCLHVLGYKGCGVQRQS